VIFGVGAWIAHHALTSYTFGTLSRIGPGLFPTALGFAMAFLGLVIAIPAAFRSGAPVSFPFRPMLAVLGSIVVFALLVDTFGLVPAVIALVVGAILADDQHGWKSGILLTAFAAIAVWLIFGVLLGVSFRFFGWPW
jgi:hypothetical protein